MKTYKTAEIAKIIGIHANTVRLYEALGLIPKPRREPNGYRVFTEVHLEQLRLARLAFQIEVLQNGLRKKIVRMVKVAATGDYDTALEITHDYLREVRAEIAHAEEATEIVREMLGGKPQENVHFLKRKEVSEYLQISADTLRNWELNGLLAVKRKQNRYRVYTDEDIRRLKIIRSLRCANYSLQAILTMLRQLSANPQLDIKKALDTPNGSSEVIAVCDKLVSSLSAAQENAQKMTGMLQSMKKRFS